MTKVQQAREFFAPGDTLECVENTYRPCLNGTRRRVVKVGASFIDCIQLDGEDAGKPCRGVIPTRVCDVIAINDHTATFALDNGKLARLAGHTVTYRRVVA